MTMSKEEQIEELTNDLVFTNRYGTYNAVAEYLINKGYRKQNHGTGDIMTDEHKRELREHMSMKAFTFMLDDVTKMLVLQKLRENNLNTKKGTISALIRVLLNYFTDLIPDDPTFEYIVQQVEEEYIFTTKKNKRSTM